MQVSFVGRDASLPSQRTLLCPVKCIICNLFPDKMENQLDMIFVIGSSGRDARSVFSQQKELMKSVIDKAKHLNAAFGVVQYDYIGRKSIGINPKSWREALWRTIDKLQPMNAGTRPDEGLKEAIDMFKKEGRPNARRVIILSGNNRILLSDSELRRIAQSLSREAIEVFVVGYGSQVDQQQVNIITLDNSNVHIVQPGETVENTTDIVAEKPLTGIVFYICLLIRPCKLFYRLCKPLVVELS